MRYWEAVKSVGRTLRRNPLRVVLLVLACCGLFASFFSTISFLSAVPAEEFGRAPAWSAGVMNHGNYYEWWLVEDAPLLFGLTIAGWLVCPVLLGWLVVAEWRDRHRFRG